MHIDPYADYVPRYSHHPHHSHPFDHDFFNRSFFSGPFGASSSRSRGRTNPFTFTDPFALFDAIFEDMHRQFDGPFFGNTSPFGRQSSNHASPFDRMGMFPFGALPPFPNSLLALDSSFPGGSSFHSSQTLVPPSGSRNDHWVSQSRMTRTINGVTESVWKRTDSNVSIPSMIVKYLLLTFSVG